MIGEPTKLTILYVDLYWAAPTYDKDFHRTPNFAFWATQRGEVTNWLQTHYRFERQKARRIARILTGWTREGYVPSILVSQFKTRKLP